MLSTFAIALREGLEACLIVGILIAYITKTQRRHLLAPLWAGAIIAIVASFALGGFLTFTSAELTPRGEEFFAGTTSLLAVGFVTWMVFWMRSASRGLRDELNSKMEKALITGPLALAATAFFAVAREGLETALFVYANFKTVAATSTSSIGLILGFAVAITLGALVYKRSVKLNLSKFFTYTSVALIVVAAGVLSYGVHEFQELGWLAGADAFAWDVTSWMAKDSLLATILGGTIGFDTTTSWFQLAMWALYLAVTLWSYLRPRRVSLSTTHE